MMTRQTKQNDGATKITFRLFPPYTTPVAEQAEAAKLKVNQYARIATMAMVDDPRERLRRVIRYLENNRNRMKYAEYRREGLPTTRAWMESAVKEINYRIKGTEMFWNNPAGAEAILQIRAAALCDDDRLVHTLTRRPGQSTLRRSTTLSQAV